MRRGSGHERDDAGAGGRIPATSSGSYCKVKQQRVFQAPLG